jgi:hypothetical protein
VTTPTPETTPDQPVPAPGQPAPAGFVPQDRFNGLVKKVEELTLANREFVNQLASKTSEIEQLKTQLGIKETEKSAAVSERDSQLQQYVQKASALESEVTSLRALKLKMDVARELGRPDLLKVADTIPNLTDREALKTVMGSIAGLVDDAVKEREKQLLAGVMPPSPSNVPAPNLPASASEWDRHINALPLGSPEREKAMDAYWNFLEQQNQ